MRARSRARARTEKLARHVFIREETRTIMLKSMTAYAQGSYECPIGHFVIEIHSVNRKHLEINTILPKEILCFDTEIKKWIAASIGRGQVSVRITLSFDSSFPVAVHPNLALSTQIVTAWKKISLDCGLSVTDDVLLKLLSQEKGILVYGETLHDKDSFHHALHELVKLGLHRLIAVKQFEGEALYRDIAMRLGTLSHLIEQIECKSGNATSHYREKLKEKLDAVSGSSVEVDERLLREVCIYAEKIDINEEIIRFKSHLTQVNALINENKHDSVGKTFEFFIQELNREANTIASKAPNIEILHLDIQIKSELEKIREQLQNIE